VSARPLLRRAGRRLLAAAALLAAGCGGDHRPPVVFVSIDTVRADRLPDWGYARGRTPHLGSLVADGVRYANAYAQVPLTLPSHVSLMTGLLPPDAGVRSNLGYRFEAAGRTPLAVALAERGYTTAAFVSAYVLRRETGFAAGFATFDDAMEVSEAAPLSSVQRAGPETTAAAASWLAALPRRTPYFLFLHLYEPHYPYTPPPEFRDLADPYDGEIAAADAALGTLLAALAARGDSDDALIAVFSDHGEGLGDHGEKEHGVLLYRETLHVPLVLKLPGGARAGETVDAPVGLIDLYPTVAELAGVRLPARAAGRSLLAAGDAARPIYSEALYPRIHFGWSELRSMIDGRHHAIAGPDPELYDVVADPGETRNLRVERRREYAELAAALDAVPLAFEPPAPASAEEMARLQALGYVGGTAVDRDGPLADPKTKIGVLDDMQRAFQLTHDGRLAEALALTVQILGEQPDLVDLRNQLSAILRRLGRFEESLATYEETERRFPQLAESLAMEKAKLYLDLGRIDDAERAARSILDSNELGARFILSAVAGRRGEWARAAEEARRGIGDPRNPRVPAMLLLAQALSAQGKVAEALTEIDRAAARLAAPGVAPVPNVHATRGDLLARLGRESEAEAAFRSEIERFPDNPDPYVRLAILFAAGHRFDEIEPTLDALAATGSPRALLAAAETMERLGNAEGAAAYRRRARAAGAAPAGGRR
jgi:arylsulfatase A-like enzyme